MRAPGTLKSFLGKNREAGQCMIDQWIREYAWSFSQDLHWYEYVQELRSGRLLGQ